jgi:phosphoglycolate phosphatase-like HAD superfamily hydrolase
MENTESNFGISKATEPIVLVIIALIIGMGALIIPSMKLYVANDIPYFIKVIFYLIGLFFTGIGGIELIKLIKKSRDKNYENDRLISNSSSYKDFVEQLKINEFEEILIMVHTGKNSLEILRQKIMSCNDELKINIKILLKHPYSETTHRMVQIENHIRTFKYDLERKNCSVNFRYYNGLPYFHAMFCKVKNSERYRSYISYYRWNEHKTEACQNGSVVDIKNELFLVTKSWFEHLYSKNNLHTIVFDLDDTIINSYDAQIKSWIYLIRSILKNLEGLGKFKQNLKPDITQQNIRQKIKTIFLKTTKTQERWKYLFDDKLTSDDIQKMESIRFKRRTLLTVSEATLFDECKNTIEALSRIYNLVIISSTNEEIVQKVLEKHHLSSYFSLYFGRNNQIGEWNSVEDKTPYLIKVSNLVGVPFDRIAFIGDSQIDYNAARQLNVKFIAANMIAKRLNRSSLITEHMGLSIDSYQNNCLLKMFEKEFD